MRARAVWLYHVEGCTQNAIATQLGIDRVMVVRLLADARHRNEVRVTLFVPVAEFVATERELETRFGIARVVLAPFSDVVRRRMIWNSQADFRAEGAGSLGSDYAA